MNAPVAVLLHGAPKGTLAERLLRHNSTFTPLDSSHSVSPERDLGRKAIETVLEGLVDGGPLPLAPKGTLAERLLRLDRSASFFSSMALSAPKGTLAERLLRQLENIKLSIGQTKNPPRKGPWPKGY